MDLALTLSKFADGCTNCTGLVFDVLSVQVRRVSLTAMSDSVRNNMKISITINTDNHEFRHTGGARTAEVARVLRAYASKIEESDKFHDPNGSTIGKAVEEDV